MSTYSNELNSLRGTTHITQTRINLKKIGFHIALVQTIVEIISYSLRSSRSLREKKKLDIKKFE